VDDPSGREPHWPSGQTRETVVDAIVQDLSPDFRAASGEVTPVSTGVCPVASGSAMAESAECLCGFMGSTLNVSIRVDDRIWPHTSADARTVFIQSPFSGMELGSWSGGPRPHRIPEPSWRILGHELCGHAKLGQERGVSDPNFRRAEETRAGGRPFHDQSYTEENLIAAEHGAEARGLFAERRHHGEAFGRVVIEGFDFNSTALPATAADRLAVAEDFIRRGEAAGLPLMVEVIGHADPPSRTGTGNAVISQRRAAAVARAIRSRVRSPNIVFRTGLAAAECPSAERDPQCRKVEIFLFRRMGASASRS